eukprot:11212947-Lingulodinium_polyedra.AAC.1
MRNIPGVGCSHPEVSERVSWMAETRKKGSRPASFSAPKNPVVKVWLVDTGCGHDLVTRTDALKMEFTRKVSSS